MKIAIYARVGTEQHDDNSLTMSEQLNKMHKFAIANGNIVALEFVDLDASSKDDKRYVFQQVIADAIQKPSDFEGTIIHCGSSIKTSITDFQFIFSRTILK
jgi:DNA invertase Pin-like site-specific DNA recombinase